MSSSMTVASQRTSSPKVVMVKVKNAQHAFSRAARSRTQASVPGWARSRKQMPVAVFSRPIRAWLNRRWYSLRRSGPVSGAPVMSQTIGVVGAGKSMILLLGSLQMLATCAGTTLNSGL